MIAKLICRILGHRRGKFHANVMEQGSERVVGRMMICKRCDATWTRKVKA